MEIFQYLKINKFKEYLSSKVIVIMNSNNYSEIRKELKESYDIAFFNVLTKHDNSVDVMIKTKNSVSVYSLHANGRIESKGGRPRC